jgi:hypothetical protein
MGVVHPLYTPAVPAPTQAAIAVLEPMVGAAGGAMVAEAEVETSGPSV